MLYTRSWGAVDKVFKPFEFTSCSGTQLRVAKELESFLSTYSAFAVDRWLPRVGDLSQSHNSRTY